MKYIFIDESGSSSIKNGGLYYFVATVFFDSIEDVEEALNKIDVFKTENNIPVEYEFHFSRNAVKNKNKFSRFIADSNFSYKVFRIEKRIGGNPIHEAAAAIINSLTVEYTYNIRLDSNPILFHELRKILRERKIKAKITEVKSKNNTLIQVADYLAGIERQKLKKLP